MKYIEKIESELAKRGINAEKVEVFKNGIRCDGFQIMTNSNVCPVVYYSEGETINAFLQKVYSAMREIPDLDLDTLRNKDFVKSHLYVSVHRRSNGKDVLSRNHLNLEVVMRLHIFDNQDERGSIKVSSSLLAMSGLSIDDAWKIALANTKALISIRSMASVLGVSEELFPTLFYIATTDNGMDGASALLYVEIFKDFCIKHKIDACIILPSSTQEVIIVPDEGCVCYKDFAVIVNDINNTNVDPLIQLDPVVYRYDLCSNMIKIVAEV